MDAIIEKGEAVTCVRLNMPIAIHGRAHTVKRLMQAKKNEDVTVLQIYMKAVEIGLAQLEKDAA